MNQKAFPNLKVKIKSHLSDFGALGTLKPPLFVVDTVMCNPDSSSEKFVASAACSAVGRQPSAVSPFMVVSAAKSHLAQYLSL